jgi:hypothetical protein
VLAEIDPRDYPLLRGRPWLAPGEMLSAASALALLVSMFVLGWYGTVGPPRGPEGSGLSSAENAWHGLTVLRWLMLLTIVAVLGSLVLHARRCSRPRPLETAWVFVSLAGLTTAGLIFRVLIDPPTPSSVVDVKLGGYLGLISGVGILIGALDALRGELALRAAHRRGPDEELSFDASPR